MATPGSTTTGVNPAGDAGDTSPQFFGWGDVNGNIPPILLRTFGYSRTILIALRSLSFKPISFGYKTPQIRFSQAGGQSAHKARPPNLELALTPLSTTALLRLCSGCDSVEWRDRSRRPRSSSVVTAASPSSAFLVEVASVADQGLRLGVGRRRRRGGVDRGRPQDGPLRRRVAAVPGGASAGRGRRRSLAGPRLHDQASLPDASRHLHLPFQPDNHLLRTLTFQL